MLPILFLFFISAQAATILENDIDDCPYTYDNQNYRRQSILSIKGLPTNLAYNPNTKELLFTLIDLDSLQNDEVQTKMDQYILTNGEPIKVDNVNGQAAAVDAVNNKVYIGTDDGLTVLNETFKGNFVSFKDEDIVQLFKPANREEVLYAVLYPDNNVYAIDLKRNEKYRVENVPCAYIVAVDENDNVFFECESKYVHVLIKGFTESIKFVGITKNSSRAIAVDPNYRVVLATNDGLYHLRADNVIPKKLMDLDFTPSGIAFSGDEMWLAANGYIYKYTSTGC